LFAYSYDNLSSSINPDAKKICVSFFPITMMAQDTKQTTNFSEK
jgi:hypothetical protein